MFIETFEWKDVNPDGTFKNGPGAIRVKEEIVFSDIKGGCGSGSCNCSPGYWLSKGFDRTPEGIVRVFKVTFDNKKEMKKEIEKGELQKMTYEQAEKLENEIIRFPRLHHYS